MALSVTPTSGAGPYLITASFSNISLIDGVKYKLEVRIPKAIGSCPAVGTGSNQTSIANSLLLNGSFELNTSVDAGSCQTIALAIVDIASSEVISLASEQINNL